ncbi:hypothetical protein Vadar_000560 [Vaccinium darrowii]|uniref:Uncharacterized protein n=1 Tax=Vaccinium darrowii TaxID=229202 RepID=A0ACB7XVP1_9ERIC|nr:hypothetical protein Vadar_000560 [Vaccinium darrowii]
MMMMEDSGGGRVAVICDSPHVVAFDEVRVVDISEDEDFTADLVFDGVFVVSVDDFEGVELSGWAVDDFVDCAAAADSSSLSREEKFNGGVPESVGVKFEEEEDERHYFQSC